MFYGLSFIERFHSYGAAKWFLIFTLTDEAYSLHCSCALEDDVNEKAVHIIIGVLVMFYWVLFSVLGALAGSLITFDTTGLDFALTALFITILIDQIRAAENAEPAHMAAAASAVSLLIFGADSFILPALILSTAGLCLLQPRLEKEAVK